MAPPNNNRAHGWSPLTLRLRHMALGEAQTVTEGTTVAEASRQAAQEGVVLVTDANGLLSGILTHTAITTRVVADGLQVEQTLVSEIMTRNPSFVSRKTLIIEALQIMVQGQHRHLPVVEDGEAICIMRISYCIRHAILGHDQEAKHGGALESPIGLERQSGSNFLDAYKLIERLSEHMCKPLSTIIAQNKRIATVAPSDTVHVAIQKMRELQVNYVVITSRNSLQGILTLSDVLSRVTAHNGSPELTLVEKVMTLHPNCATLDTTIIDALRLMDTGKFSHIPVLDGDGTIAACLDVLQLLKLFDSTLDVEPQEEEHFDSQNLSYVSTDRMDTKCLTPSVLELIILEGSSEPTNLPFALLQDITNNFSAERTIGHGGFGVVFKGVLQNGCVAVKKLSNSYTIEDGPFHREANFLMNVKHPNIVRFLGFCAHTEYQAIKVGRSGRYDKYIYAEMRERLLCFEYMSKGSLDNHLTDELRGLEWHTRYQIIKGICEGLLYLHTEKCIVHMDLKPANILLDDNMMPKISDFGISRHLDGISRAVTKERLLSLGYCAPEYLHRGELSFKSDMYALGVIIKELVTGRKEDPNIKNVLRRWRYRWNKSSKYPPLGHQQVTKCIELAVRCMAENSKSRPFIWDIVNQVNGMESTDEDMGGANESTDGQISPYEWELLSLDPLELRLPLELNKEISCALQLTNERDDHIAFSIHATKNAHYEYRIEPSQGVVPPRSGCSVTVTLLARRKGVMPTDQLTVRMARVEQGLSAEGITSATFDAETGNLVDEVDLTVVLITLANMST